MAPSELLEDVVERVALSGHDGLSGAGLERVLLPDGRAFVVKRATAHSDLTLALTGGTVSREYLLWRSGALDRLPDGVGHAVVDAWHEGDTTVIVMRDLGANVLTWEDRLTTGPTRWMVGRIAALHRTFLDRPPADLTPLDRVLDLFAPHRIAALADDGNELMTQVSQGWDIFGDKVPADVAAPVLALLSDVTALTDALAARPLTLCHGDLATVNMAFERDELVLLDWAMPTAAPGALDITRLLAGCSSVLEPSRDDVIAAYAEAAGPAYDEAAMGLSVLAALVWLGWNKALDAHTHPEPSVRIRERADLDWWVRRSRQTLESGLL